MQIILHLSSIPWYFISERSSNSFVGGLLGGGALTFVTSYLRFGSFVSLAISFSQSPPHPCVCVCVWGVQAYS